MSQEEHGMPYSDIVKDHFFNPRNTLKEDEESFQADALGEAGSSVCGDWIKFWVKIDPETEKISDCKWKTFGCASAIASTSVLSEMVIGLTIDEAMKIKPGDIVEKLGGLPEKKIHCSVLGDRGLRQAIEAYLKEKGLEDRLAEYRRQEVVCECAGVTRGEIEDAISRGVKSFEAIQEETNVSTACGECKEEIQKILSESAGG